MEDKKLKEELNNIKMLIINGNKHISIGGFVSKKTILKFFDYSESSLARLETNGLNSYNVGSRKFYLLDDIIALIRKSA